MSEDTYKALPAVIILSSLLVCVAFSVVCVAKYGTPSFPSFPNFSIWREPVSRVPLPYTTENTLQYLQSRTAISNRPLIQTPAILNEEPIILLPSQAGPAPIILPTVPIVPILPNVPILPPVEPPVEYLIDSLTEIPPEIIYPEVPK